MTTSPAEKITYTPHWSGGYPLSPRSIEIQTKDVTDGWVTGTTTAGASYGPFPEDWLEKEKK